MDISTLRSFAQRAGFKLLLAWLLILITAMAMQAKAQGVLTVKGIVRDAKTRESLPGITIMDNNQVVGMTNVNGAFEMKVKMNDMLVFTGVGYHRQTIKVVGTADRLEILLTPSTNDLNEVVVTALGIKRSEKALGYSQQTVSNSELTDARPDNWSEALRGKVAGLNIASLGGPMNSQEIRLRGESSLTTNGNGALIVIDGIPVSGGLTSSGASNAYMGGAESIDVAVDFGNGIANINPEDIESISILKGPGATALYGSRAANGAVLITTKSGKTVKGLGITFNSNTKLDIIQHWPDWQYEYGQGDGKTNYDKDGKMYYSYGATADGKSTSGSSSAFGPKFDGQMYFQYDPVTMKGGTERTPWVPYKDNRKAFWQTGQTYTNSLTFESAGEQGSFRGSVSYIKNNWLLPNTGSEKANVSLNGVYRVSKNIKVSSVVNYNNVFSNNLPGLGYNNQSIAYFMIFQNPNVDLNWYKPGWKPGQEGISMIRPYSSFIDNPFIIANYMANRLENNIYTGNLRADIQLLPKLSLMVRTGLNANMQNRNQERPWDLNRYGKGYYLRQAISAQEINSDFLLSYNDVFGKNAWKLSASVGGNNSRAKYRRTDNALVGLVVPGVYKMTNGVGNPSVGTYDNNKIVNSVYGMAAISWRDKIFLDLTGRNDWSSTLPQENWSFFYPSANLSVMLSDLVKMGKQVSFAKLRFSVAGVGNDTDPYRTSKYYNRSDFASSAEAPTQLYNVNFQPELTRSYETGLNIAFFKNRLNIDASAYKTSTRNQILAVPVEPSSGFTSAIMNMGEVQNRGLELIITGSPVKTKDFTWNSTFNWSATRSKVISLDPRLKGMLSIMGSANASLVAVEGGIASALYGQKFIRNEEGKIIYNNGLPTRTAEIDYVGDINPKWRAGWANNLNYKGFKFSALVDGQYKGVIFSHSHHKLTEQGKLKHTLAGREEGYIIGDGVVKNADGSYSPNTVKVLPATYYAEYYAMANTEANTFDNSFIKLREVTIGYSFPAKMFKKGVLQGLNVSLYGRNLAWWGKFPMYDPEVATQAGGTGFLTGVEVGQMPVPASYGLNITVKL